MFRIKAPCAGNGNFLVKHGNTEPEDLGGSLRAGLQSAIRGVALA